MSAVLDSHAGHVSVDALPPDFPDPLHVPNGCYLSALGYLAKFSAAFPHELAETRTVLLLNADRRLKPHTIALMTWKEAWWGRDEYFGVFRVSRVRKNRSLDGLTALAEGALAEHATALIRSGFTPPSVAPSIELSPAARELAVLNAAHLIPHPAEFFWVSSAGRALLFLSFRPTEGMIAIYDPVHGTAQMETIVRDDADLVAQAARRLGYAVDTVRRAFDQTPVAMAANVAESAPGIRTGAQNLRTEDRR